MSLQKIWTHRSATFYEKINDCNSNEEPLYFYKVKFYYAGCIRQKLFEENEVLFKILGFITSSFLIG